MAKVIVFRKGAAPKLSAAKVREALTVINGRTRVQRDDLVTFMLNGGFGKLPALKPSQISSDMQRASILDKGYIIPDSCLGRIGQANRESANSVRLWITQQMEDYGITSDDFSVVLEDHL